MTSPPVLSGGCACGAVRFTVSGAPKRAGLCHCLTCRKAPAAAFNPFVVYEPGAVDVTGEVRIWRSSPDYARGFCGTCGSRVYGGNAGEIELSLGSFDAVGPIAPQYESWVSRREPWLRALDVPQHAANREP
ncbi:MAG: GFA family protein [Pseudomonadota bacterium]